MISLISNIVSGTGFNGVFRSLRNRLRGEAERRVHIRELTQMMHLDQHILRDIGLTRDDIHVALLELRRRS